MTKLVEQEYKTLLKRILHDVHCKNYKRIMDYVDCTKFPDFLDFFKDLEAGLEEGFEDYDSIDEYGTTVDDYDENERINIIEFDENKGFEIDYMISADGEILDMVLQLEFIEDDNSNNGLKCIFLGIDYA